MNNEVICCLGDSITATGRWVGRIFERLASDGVKVYNCGVPGDSAYWSLNRIYADCLCYSPSTVIVMFGVNDVEPWIYPRDTEEKIKKIDSLIEKHKISLEKIINILQSSGSKVVLCDPPPYVEGDGYESEDHKCNADIDRCRENIYFLANKYNCDIINIHDVLIEASKNERVIRDRVHPTDAGYDLIAKTVLKYLGLSDELKDFSKVNLDRMKAEEYYKKLMYGKYDIVNKYFMGNNIEITPEAIMERCKSVMERATNEYISSSAKLFYEEGNELQNAQMEVVKRTIDMMAWYNSQNSAK